MNIHLEIAGYNFTIKYKSEDAKFFPTLISEIKTIYSNFVVKKHTLRKQSVTIFIHHSNKVSLDVKQEKYNSILLFQKISNSYYETYSHISIAQLSIIILRIIRAKLHKEGGFLLHASASYINGEAIVFLGKSGAGKSTIVRFLSDTNPIIADDNIIIRKLNNQYFVFQSPLLQKFPMNIFKQPIPLSKIYFLKQDTICTEKQIVQNSTIFRVLLEHLWTEKDSLKVSAAAIQQFYSKFDSFYELRFTNKKKQVEELFSSFIS